MRFLAIRLFAPLASFGDLAVGELRPSLSAPTRSMLLGLVAGALGIPREDEAQQLALERGLGVAVRVDAPGTLLVDYHTAQAPDEPRRKVWTRRNRRPPATRREELACVFDAKGERTALDTQLSTRQYRTDAVFAGCLWVREEAADFGWTLEQLQQAFRKPVFAPFAGRKAAVFALPFEPTLLEAANPVEALRGVSFSLDGVLKPLLSGERTVEYRWEGEWEGLAPTRTQTRRDRVASRARWQFLPRPEHVKAETLRKDDDVSESN